MNTRNLLLGALMAAVALGAQAKTQRLDYAAYAGQPVSEFRYTQLYNWERTGDKSLVVWTKPSTAYLLTLRDNCDVMAGQYSIQIGDLGGLDGRVRAGTDDIHVGQRRCKISTIQPLDLARIKAERA